jgi:hypothetical protein
VELIDRAYMGSLQHPDQQCLILSSIMVDDLNTGYGSVFHNIILKTINGRTALNLQELVDICESEQAAGVEYLRFDFTQSRLIVLEAKLIAEATKRVLAEKKIEYDRSSDLRQAKAVKGAKNNAGTPANGKDVLEVPPSLEGEMKSPTA